jgi:hypothetical protein
VTGPWARAFLDRYQVPEVPGTGVVAELRVEPSLITARVGDRAVTLSATPIPPGVWAAIAAQVTPELVRVGADEDVAAVVGAVAAAIERDPSTLLRFRGYAARPVGDDDAWYGGELPPLPPPARRPPDSVPKRFGASGIPTADGELVEVLVRAYRAFAE